MKIEWTATLICKQCGARVQLPLEQEGNMYADVASAQLDESLRAGLCSQRCALEAHMGELERDLVSTTRALAALSPEEDA